MTPKVKRFMKQYGAAADAVARLDVHQVTREEMADSLVEAFRGKPDFRPGLFRALASDPLCPCAGYGDNPCPEGREIRVSMHLSTAADGRSAAWQEYRPVVRCVSCGARMFVRGYPQGVTS